MLNRKYMIVGFLTLCLSATLLVGVTNSVPYDPWCDVNDDGIIDIVDIVSLAIRFGEDGTPINKTELLLELQSKLDSLNASVIALLDLQEALEARIPKKGYISVPAAAFVLQNNNENTRNWGGRLDNLETHPVTFHGAVQLPHGATVTNFTTYWFDDNASNVLCWLNRGRSTGGHDDLASADSSGTTGYGSSYDDTIVLATVDNSQYGYWVEVVIPHSDSHLDYLFMYAIIEYEYPA